MPEEAYWESLFNVPLILDTLGVGAGLRDVVEVGCGYGTFTVPVAQRISGAVQAFDLEPGMIGRTQQRVREAGLTNVVLHRRDVLAAGFGLQPRSFDGVLLFNILHAEKPEMLLQASAELLVPGGRVLAIHWRSDIPTPRGPDLSIRPRPEPLAALARECGLAGPQEVHLLAPWHFGLVLTRA